MPLNCRCLIAFDQFDEPLYINLKVSSGSTCLARYVTMTVEMIGFSMLLNQADMFLGMSLNLFRMSKH